MARFEFLGRLSDQYESPMQMTLPGDVSTVAALRLWLNARLQTEEFSKPSIRAIVNANMASETSAVANADTIVFYPPVGGG